MKEQVLIQGDFSMFFTSTLLGILRYTEQEVYVQLINSNEENFRLNFKEITFLQPLDFLSLLEQSLEDIEIPGKSQINLILSR